MKKVHFINAIGLIYFSMVVAIVISVGCAKIKTDNYLNIPLMQSIKQYNSERVEFNFEVIQIPKEIIGNTETGGNHTSVFVENDSALIVLQNCANNTLDVYNIEKPSYIHSFNMPYDGFLCEQMYSLFKDKAQTFLLHWKGNLYNMQISDNGVLENLNQHPQMLSEKILVEEGLDMYNEIFLSNDSLLYFPVYNTNRKKKYGYPVGATYNLKTGELNPTGIKYPYMLYKNNYGLLDRLHQYYFDDKIIYSFAGLPEIWKFNLSDKSLERYFCKSSFQTDSILPINFKRSPETKDLLWQHFMHTARYERLVYDPFRNCYYRFFVPAMPQKSEKGYFNTYKDRRLVLMVLDENFNIMGETMLPEACFFYFFVVASKQGLFINYGPFVKVSENGFSILKITFTKN